MRTASSVCRIRVTGYHLLHRAVKAVRLSLAYREARLYSSKRPRSIWRKVTSTTRDVQPQIAVKPQHDTEHWISQCDLFLPLELRSKTWEDNLSTFAGVRSAEHLPKVLAESRSAFPQGILTHIALVQKRWSAVFFLCQALLQYNNKPLLKPLTITNGSPWSALKAAGPLVDVDFFQKPLDLRDIILFQDKKTSVPELAPLNRITGTPFAEQDEAAELWRFAIGQVWRCIGHIMLAGTKEDSPLQVDMVSFVLQVVAAMHSSGVVSDDIYLFDSDSVTSSIRKPPFLHLMSSRIMTALSDVMWKKVEPDLMRDIAYVAARHAHKGAESPAGKNGPRLRALDQEVWLELILWGCVHGDHFHVGAELLQAMFEMDRKHQWKTVPWNDLQQQLEAKLLSQQDMRKSRSWYQRLAGSIEGYSEEEPYVQLGRNTVSEEVVQRLCDGVLSSPESHLTASTATGVLVANYFNIIDRYRGKTSDTNEHSLLYRTVDGSIKNVLQLTQVIKRDTRTDDVYGKSSYNEKRTDIVQADPQHSLLTKTLAHHIDQLDVYKALQSYEQLKTWSGNTKHDPGAQTALPKPEEAPLSSRIELPFLVPSGLLAALLHLVTNSRLFQTGQSLIEPFTHNGEVIPTTFRRSTALSQAILRFAGASSNPAILRQLRGKDYPDLQSLDVEALRELLHLEIADGNWFMARKLLQSIAESRNTLALLEVATRIAVQIMHIQSRARQTETDQLMGLLTEILSGQYRPQRSTGVVTNWQEPRQFNQLSQILMSIGDERFHVLEALLNQGGQLSNPIALPTSVFNMLLEAVIDVYDMSAGQRFVKTWCRKEPKVENRPGNRDFCPISPNLDTMRILLKPFTSRFRRFYRHKEVFTSTGARGKDANPLEVLAGGRENIQALYESIIGFYYTSYGRAELQMVFFVMDICKTWGLDQQHTFYSLLQPMEETTGLDGSAETTDTTTAHNTQ